MNIKSTRELEAQRAVLLRQLKRAGSMVEGSLATVPRKCGNENCECMKGVTKHEAVILCKKVKGRSVAIHVPKDLRERVRHWNQEHKRIKRVMKDISEINEQIIRNYVSDKRNAQRVCKSLKVMGKKSSRNG